MKFFSLFTRLRREPYTTPATTGVAASSGIAPFHYAAALIIPALFGAFMLISLRAIPTTTDIFAAWLMPAALTRNLYILATFLALFVTPALSDDRGNTATRRPSTDQWRRYLADDGAAGVHLSAGSPTSALNATQRPSADQWKRHLADGGVQMVVFSAILLPFIIIADTIQPVPLSHHLAAALIWLAGGFGAQMLFRFSERYAWPILAALCFAPPFAIYVLWDVFLKTSGSGNSPSVYSAPLAAVTPFGALYAVFTSSPNMWSRVVSGSVTLLGLGAIAAGVSMWRTIRADRKARRSGSVQNA